MQTQSTTPDLRALLPQCPCCGAPMRVRTIEVKDRHEQVRFACTACSAETMQSYHLGR